MRRLTALLIDRRASSAAEFAMVLPLLIMFLLGIIDVGRLLWTVNRIEKSTQMGVRFAIVTNPIPVGLTNSSSKVSAVGLVVGTNPLQVGEALDKYDM